MVLNWSLINCIVQIDDVVWEEGVVMFDKVIDDVVDDFLIVMIENGEIVEINLEIGKLCLVLIVDFFEEMGIYV